MIQQRPLDPGRPRLSSNNPFRKSSASSVSSWDVDTPEPPVIYAPRLRAASSDARQPTPDPVRQQSGSLRDKSLSESQQRQQRQRIMAMQGYSLSDQNVSAVPRPRPNPNRNSMYRKSTNPFINDNSDDSFDDDDEESLFGAPATAPRRPPSSSKPTASTRQRRANSDSSLMDASPRPERAYGSASGPREHRSHRDRDTKEHSHVKEHREHSHRDTKEHREHSHRDPKEHREHREHRDKEHREKDPKEHRSRREHSSRKDKARRKGQPLDVIDKLDVTGLFGPGSFHHDGPFDACNPHRNSNSKRAPVKAFPVDGANNSLGGVDASFNKYATENTIMGRSVDEAYLDFNASAPRRMRPQFGPDNDPARSTFNPSAKEDPVHGDLTLGLGSSTFLDGTPASREAISKSAEEGATNLGRKKSLVQRLRGDMPPPRPRYNSTNSSNGDLSSAPVVRTSSHPVNPTRATPTPPPYTDRKPSVTIDATAVPSSSTSGAAGSLLRRVKSLKVGSRRRAS